MQVFTGAYEVRAGLSGQGGSRHCSRSSLGKSGGAVVAEVQANQEAPTLFVALAISVWAVNSSSKGSAQLV